MRRAVTLLVLLSAACTGEQATMRPPPAASPTAPPAAAVTPAREAPPPVPATFSIERATETVARLAAGGPREATSPAYRRAARLIQRRLRAFGWSVRRDSFAVPRGVSWGVPVPAGETFNVVAEPPGFDPARPHVLVGAHLDTVPQSPGANDNASGIAILLELARLAAAEGTRTPLVLVAFGAEEPRAPGDDGHHYGSRHHVELLRSGPATGLIGVLAIDRVGFGERALACTGGRSPLALRDMLLRAASRLELSARACDNRTSDHWPFERASFTVARLDGGRFPGYHSAGDTPERVSAAQVARVGAIAWEALRGLRPRDFA